LYLVQHTHYTSGLQVFTMDRNSAALSLKYFFQINDFLTTADNENNTP